MLLTSCDVSSKRARSPAEVLTVAINAGVEGQAIAELSKDFPEARIEIVELPYTNLREKLQQTLGTGRSTYDVVMLDDPWFPELAQYLSRLGTVPDALLDDLIPASLHLGRDPHQLGELKALPFVGNCQLLFYRKDLLGKVGLDAPPDNWPDLLAAAREISDTVEGASGYCIRGKSGAPIVTDFLPVLWSMGGSVFVDRGQPRAVAIDSGETREALRMYKQLADLSPPGAKAYDWTEMTAAFTAGTAAMQLNWPAAVSTIDAEIPRGTDGERLWGVAMPPGGKGFPEGTSMAGNWLLGIPAASEKKEQALGYLLWLFDRQADAAAKGNPPTRASVYKELEGNPSYFHFGILHLALRQSTPRPRTPRWNAVEDVISQSVSGVITDRLTVEEAVSIMEEGVVGAMDTANAD